MTSVGRPLQAIGGLLLALLMLLPADPRAAQAAEAEPLRRTILALYNGEAEDSVRLSRVASYAAMPLNHLGFKLVYHDVRDPLPEPDNIPGLRGVVTWFGGDVPNLQAYLRWATGAMDRGIPFAVLGDSGVLSAPLDAQNRFLGHLGLESSGNFKLLTYDVQLAATDPGMIGFERQPMRPFASYTEYRQADAEAQVFLSVHGAAGEDPHPLVIIGREGGYAAAGYEYYFDTEIVRGRWIVDPFAFFERIFGSHGQPRPDATTLAGRRIYFSHVDGDGWRNISRVSGHRDIASGATLALLDKAWAAYPGLPVTVAPIGAEMDLAYFGTPDVLKIAEKVFELPHVEAGTHTYSHPFVWGFFRRYDAQKEQEIEAKAGRLPKLESSAWDRVMAEFSLGPQTSYLVTEGATGDVEHAVMRAFPNVPWSLSREVGGSAEKIEAVLPAGKKVRLLQWPGDTSPFPKAVRETRDAGLMNMNGGDPRFDPEYPSILFVSSLAYTGNGIVQPYAQASNENTYTNLWTERFYGLRFLDRTLANTDRPRRLKPFNLYYHNYSGEHPESLDAVVSILDLASRSEIAPIEASRYAAIVDGFHRLTISVVEAATPGDPDGTARGPAWRIAGRGALNTIRFDEAAFQAVDFDRSRGVLGQRHYQGSLYVALDPVAEEPVIALAPVDRTDLPPGAGRPYLISARWPPRDLKVDGDGGFTAQLRGYGAGEQLWWVPPGRRYALRAMAGDRVAWSGTAQADPAGRLAFTIDGDGLAGLLLEATPIGDGAS